MSETRHDAHNPASDGSLVPKLCRSCEVRHRGICGALNDRELIELAGKSGKKTLEPGAIVTGDADNVENFSNILQGTAKLSKILPDGRQQIVGLQFAPDFLGRPFHDESAVSVEAGTELKLCTFPRKTVERMMRENAGLENRILRQALAQLDQARDWMVTLGRKTAREKVASFLQLIASSSDPENKAENTFELPLSRSDMGDFLGLTIETVSRQLTALKRDGVIKLEGSRRVFVPSPDRLSRETGD